MFDVWVLNILFIGAFIILWVFTKDNIRRLKQDILDLRSELSTTQKTLEQLDKQIDSIKAQSTRTPPTLTNNALLDQPETSPLPTSTIDSAFDDTLDDTNIEPSIAAPVTPSILNTENKALDENSASNPESEQRPILTKTQKTAPSKTTVPTLKKRTVQANRAEPDEQSTPIVTSLLHTLKNWFFGGNLVVRVGAIVLLMGVVLLLRLLSEHFEMPIEIKLLAVGVVGLLVAGLGLKLVKKRFTYGITLQGAGLSTAYLTAFFAYQVYHVIPSLPSFVLLGVLSAVTVALALRQNAFPLALLAFSGAFLAPILTSDDRGTVTVLFGYFLLLNVAIAIIAHYRTWKVLNLLGATVTFGLAYYWGFEGLLDAQIEAQRTELTVITVLHWLLYLFIAIRYAQQVIKYNASLVSPALSNQTETNADDNNQRPILPIDTGLMFATPLLAFGLLNTLLGDIDNALTMSSALMAAVYLIASFIFIKHNRRGQQTLIIEGMLALGFGFTALTIALAFDANWIACGWSVQGLALVWFGRRLLRGWTVFFGLGLQILAIVQLVSLFNTYDLSPSYLALSVSVTAWMVSMFLLRAPNNPLNLKTAPDQALCLTHHPSLSQTFTKSWAFGVAWRSPIFITTLTFFGAAWALFASLYIVLDVFDDSIQNIANVIAFVILLHLIAYWIINRWQQWREVSLISQVWLPVFYLILLLVLPIWDSFSSDALVKPQGGVYIFSLIAGFVLAQLWIKHWSTDKTVVSFHSTLWLTVVILLIAEFAYYLIPNANGVIAILIPSLCLIGITYAVSKNKLTMPTWFDWKTALTGSSYLFLPLLLVWVVATNWSHNGMVLGLPYIPLLNLFDITILAVLGYGLSLYRLDMPSSNIQSKSAGHSKLAANLSHDANQKLMLKALGLIGFWALSSLLVRTLHAYAGTPLWDQGAWYSEQVQTGLTILWTLTALIATFMSSRNGKRFWWFMGISLLALVVIKLVVVDLSQTDAIWRVVSFIGAGSLILLIGYLAPLPPEQETVNDDDLDTPDAFSP